jgi:hypothetical protein
MRRSFDKKGKGKLVILAMSLICIFLPLKVEASELSQKGQWKCVEDNWYLYDEDSNKLTGWQFIEGKWYFLSGGFNGLKGKMLTGWQWIDGRCYYLAENTGEICLKGAMYASATTPDGYSVSGAGAWIEGTQIIEVPGKGIQTVTNKSSVINAAILSSGSGGGGGSNRKKSRS